MAAGLAVGKRRFDAVRYKKVARVQRGSRRATKLTDITDDEIDAALLADRVPRCARKGTAIAKFPGVPLRDGLAVSRA